MSGRAEEIGPQVLMLSWLTDLSGAIATTLGRDGIGVKHAHPEGARTPLSAAEIDSIESVIVIFDGHSVRSRFGGPRTFGWRRRLRARANEACDATATAALTVGARRVLLICDARRLPPGRRAIAQRWTRGLAHRIGYECLVNGLPEFAARYAVIDSDDDVPDVAAAVVPWHAGHSTERQRGPLHPAVAGTIVTPASSAPHRTPLS